MDRNPLRNDAKMTGKASGFVLPLYRKKRIGSKIKSPKIWALQQSEILARKTTSPSTALPNASLIHPLLLALPSQPVQTGTGVSQIVGRGRKTPEDVEVNMEGGIMCQHPSHSHSSSHFICTTLPPPPRHPTASSI